MALVYELKAQATPYHNQDWADPKTSCFRGETVIYVYQPQIAKEPKEISTPTLKIERIGGCCGLGDSGSTLDVTSLKQDFYVGETVHLKIKVDNSSCSKAVSRIDLELRRNHSCTADGNVSHQAAEVVASYGIS